MPVMNCAGQCGRLISVSAIPIRTYWRRGRAGTQLVGDALGNARDLSFFHRRTTKPVFLIFGQIFLFHLGLGNFVVNFLGRAVHIPLHDAQHLISAEKNTLRAPAPNFDKDFVPLAAEYKSTGYRPVGKGTISDPQ